MATGSPPSLMRVVPVHHTDLSFLARCIFSTTINELMYEWLQEQKIAIQGKERLKGHIAAETIVRPSRQASQTHGTADV